MTVMQSRERQLWCAVILQALEEAGGKVRYVTSDSVKNLAIHQARVWLTKPNPDFIEVCFLAGLEPDAVRARAHDLIKTAGPIAGQIAVPRDKPRRKRRPPKNPRRRLINHAGETFSIAEWSERTGINEATIRTRLRYGWSVERTLTEPLQPRPGRPGVGNDFPTLKGTGGGRHAQDISELEFSE